MLSVGQPLNPAYAARCVHGRETLFWFPADGIRAEFLESVDWKRFCGGAGSWLDTKELGHGGVEAELVNLIQSTAADGGIGVTGNEHLP